MTTDRSQFQVSGLTVDVIRKDIKNLHLAAYPPNGRIRVAAPHWLGQEAIRLAVISRLGWIRSQQSRFEQQARQSDREFVTGESHYFRGRRYRLRLRETDGPAGVKVIGNATLELSVRPDTDRQRRERILNEWYRRELRAMVPALVGRWEKIVGAQPSLVGIRRVKTRWGTCNAAHRRVWVNLELAKKPLPCVEYVLVHEMVHLIERRHNDRFRELMDEFMPQWRVMRDELNRAPLAHEDWTY